MIYLKIYYFCKYNNSETRTHIEIDITLTYF